MRIISEESILSYSITRKSTEDCVNEIIKWLESSEKGKYFVCANPHALKTARRDRLFEESIKNAHLVVPDGIGIVIASRILGGSIRERVTGSDIFLGLSRALNKKRSYSCFFLGSTEDTLEKIKGKMRKDFPNIHVAGTYSPPFKAEFSEEDTKLMVEAINHAQPDVLWVGMTAPKQEKWIYVNRNKLNVKFVGPVGAVFDFYIGKVRRSHPWFQKHGLEWLPRLLREPRRLWKRSFISFPIFLYYVMEQKKKNFY